MIRLEQHGDVTRLRMSSWRSRAIDYEVSAYYTHGTLIDCGSPSVARELEPVLRQLRPAGAIITHGHEDHAGNAAVLARLGIPMWAAAETLAGIRAGHRIHAYRRFTWGQPRAFGGTVEPFDPQPLRTIPAPGHCPGHHIVWDARRRTLFSADLWLGVHVKVTQVEERPRQLLRDLRAAAALEPERMFDAHRGPVRDPVRALNAKADWLEETISVIGRRVREGWTDRAIVRAVLGGEERIGLISRGEYARANLVRNVRAGMTDHAAAAPSPTPAPDPR